MREMQKKKRNDIYVKDKNNNLVSTDIGKVELVKEYFEQMLAPSDKIYATKVYKPKEMTIPFTADEIKKASNGLKNGKSPGIDNLHAEFIKYAPDEIYQNIAEIYNDTAETGKNPEELKIGLLSPVQKPNKSRGPCENLKPIILLSILRKILTICMINRTWHRIAEKIPPEQAAYQHGRSTTRTSPLYQTSCRKGYKLQ